MSDAKPEPFKYGDVVQIDPAHDEVFGGCFMTVTEPKSFGAQGFVQIPGRGDKGGRAYYRAPFAALIWIGRAEWAPPEHEEAG